MQHFDVLESVAHLTKSLIAYILCSHRETRHGDVDGVVANDMESGLKAGQRTCPDMLAHLFDADVGHTGLPWHICVGGTNSSGVGANRTVDKQVSGTSLRAKGACLIDL